MWVGHVQEDKGDIVMLLGSRHVVETRMGVQGYELGHY
jgi:hypothetical protein